MFRLIVPIILIVISVVGFVAFTNPLYQDISLLHTQVASYNEALNNSKTLENERDKLTTKFNAINPDNLVKLQKLLPDNVDNIRLILEIEKIASPYGMELRDVKYDTKKEDAAAAGSNIQPTVTTTVSNSDYGTWNLAFSTQGTYDNFLNFVRDIESNLRIVDIASIDFSSDVGTGVTPTAAGVYKYNFKIKTYWLKN